MDRGAPSQLCYQHPTLLAFVSWVVQAAVCLVQTRSHRSKETSVPGPGPGPGGCIFRRPEQGCFVSGEDFWQVQGLQGAHFTHVLAHTHTHIHACKHTLAPEMALLCISVPGLSFSCIIKILLEDKRDEEEARDHTGWS